MAKWFLGKFDDSDDRPIAEASRLVKYSTEIFRTDLQKRKATLERDEDLSEKGRTRMLAKDAAKSIATFRNAQARIRRDLNEARKETAAKRTATKVDVQSKFEIAKWLREMSMTDRNAILRDAAAGRMAGGDEILSVVLASFPRLLGYEDHDPNFNMIRSEYLARVAPTETAELADLELAEQAIQAAGDELEAFATDLVGATFTEMLANEEGRKSWDSMDVSEKSKAVAESGKPIDELVKYGVEKTTEDYEKEAAAKTAAEEKAAFASMTMAEKVAAVQQRTDWE